MDPPTHSSASLACGLFPDRDLTLPPLQKAGTHSYPLSHEVPFWSGRAGTELRRDPGPVPFLERDKNLLGLGPVLPFPSLSPNGRDLPRLCSGLRSELPICKHSFGLPLRPAASPCECQAVWQGTGHTGWWGHHGLDR